MKILLTGDVHVGRASSAVEGGATEELLAAAAWERIVSLAIERDVAAVFVSGDLVEHSNRYFEARGPIEKGLKRLTERKIRTIAVTGNHDFDSLPEMARSFNERGLAFELLGIDGQWTETSVQSGGESLDVIGWSFPRAEVRVDPLLGLARMRRGNAPTLGVVHGDLGVPASKYAPLAQSSLCQANVDGWLLGHIHARRLLTPPGDPWILYPGSPQALDPGETGEHGVYLVRVKAGTMSAPEFIPLSTVRYERHRVDVTGCKDQAGLRGMLDRSLQELAERSHDCGRPHLTELVVDLEVAGETYASRHVVEVGDELRMEPFGDPVAIRVRSVIDDTSLPIDLQRHAQGKGLRGALARTIVQLEAGEVDSPEAADLVKRINALRAGFTPQAILYRGDEELRPIADESSTRAEAARAARRLLGALDASEGRDDSMISGGEA
jgi:exonuclease SbcD